MSSSQTQQSNGDAVAETKQELARHESESWQPPAVAPVQRVPMRVGQRGLILDTFEEMWRFASVLARTEFAPKEFRNKPESCFIAIQFGAEVGLGPLASVQNLAVINGRPTIYGDTMLALCRATGVFDDGVFSEVGSGDKEDYGYTCTVARKGGRPVARRFTIKDAQRAKLWGKDGPWTFYPQRMLQMRARAFALRDCFADALKGLYAREELDDSPTAVPFDPTKVAADTPQQLPAEQAPKGKPPKNTIDDYAGGQQAPKAAESAQESPPSPDPTPEPAKVPPQGEPAKAEAVGMRALVDAYMALGANEAANIRDKFDFPNVTAMKQLPKATIQSIAAELGLKP